MEKDHTQKYAESLDRTLQNHYYYLKKAVEEFREKCLMVSPERTIPQGIIIEIRETYKEIRQRLTEIKSIQNLLQGRYRQYYRKNPLRDKEILEIEYAIKNYYSKFELVLKEIWEKKRPMIKKEKMEERKDMNHGAES
jgi:hypothetical protein